MLVPLLSNQAQNTATQRSVEVRTWTQLYSGIYWSAVSTLALKYSCTEQEGSLFLVMKRIASRACCAGAIERLSQRVRIIVLL